MSQGDVCSNRAGLERRARDMVINGDIGTHAHNLARFISGLEVDALAADLDACVRSSRRNAAWVSMD